MKISKLFLFSSVFSLLVMFIPNIFAQEDKIGKPISISYKLVRSELIQRDKDDIAYSGQIRSMEGLNKFIDTYGISKTVVGILSQTDFNKKILFFGLTDNIRERLEDLKYSKNTHICFLDYYESGIEYKLGPAEKGMKYSYITIIEIDNNYKFPHIRIRRFEEKGLSIRF